MLSTLDKLLIGFITGVCFCIFAATASAAVTVKDDHEATVSDGVLYDSFPFQACYNGDQLMGDSDAVKVNYSFALASVGGPGTYAVYATNSKDVEIAMKWTVLVDGTAIASGTYWQNYYVDPPEDATAGGRPFRKLWEGSIASGTNVVVRLEKNTAFMGDAQARFDAVGIEQTAAPAPAVPNGLTIRDDATASYEGTWSDKSDWSGAYYGASAKFSAVATELAPQSFEQRFTAPADGVYNLYATWPLGGSEFDSAARITLSYTNYAGQAVSYSSGGTLNFQASPSTFGVTANERTFQQMRTFIGVKAGSVVKVTVDARPGFRITADAWGFKRYGTLTGEPIDEDEEPPGGDDDGSEDPPPDEEPPGEDEEPGGEPFDEDPWQIPGDDAFTEGEDYTAPWQVIDGAQQLGSHVAVQWPFVWNSFSEQPYPAKRVQAWVNGHDHMNRSYDHRTIKLGGRLDPMSLEADYFSVYWEIRVGRNGYIFLNFTNDAYTPVQRLPHMHTYVLAAIDYLLSDPEKLPVSVGSGGGGIIVRDASDLHGENWEALTRSFLKALRSSLVVQKDWTGIIPRTADQFFDPNGGGGGSVGEPGSVEDREFEQWSTPTKGLEEEDLRQFEEPEHWNKLFGSLGAPTIGTAQLDVLIWDNLPYWGDIGFSTTALWNHPKTGPIARFLRDGLRAMLLFGLGVGCVFYVVSRLRTL